MKKISLLLACLLVAGFISAASTPTVSAGNGCGYQNQYLFTNDFSTGYLHVATTFRITIGFVKAVEANFRVFRANISAGVSSTSQYNSTYWPNPTNAYGDTYLWVASWGGGGAYWYTAITDAKYTFTDNTYCTIGPADPSGVVYM